jgi:sortase A
VSVAAKGVNDSAAGQLSTGRCKGKAMDWLTKVERLLIIAGLLMLGIYLGARVHQSIFSHLAVRTFDRQREQEETSSSPTLVAKAPDFSLWSPKRIQDYEAVLAVHFDPAVALLRIPKIDLEVPVLKGTDDLTLNRGVGLIEGTAQPHENGNIGIAGHRDGFFRGLKDVQEGDRIDLVTTTGVDSYQIDRIVIVKPDDVSVLGVRDKPSITLVTCYPFYFVGSAPERYIVQASLLKTGQENIRSTGRVPAQTKNLAQSDLGR